MSDYAPIDLQDHVQLILGQLSFKYRTIDKNTFSIRKNERQYIVYLENLPDVRIERKEPLGYFEGHDSIELAKTAAYFVSDTQYLALVLVDEHQKVALFRKEFTAETDWGFGAQLYRSLDDIDQSVKAFREACSVDDELYKLRLVELYQQSMINNEKQEA